MGAMRRTFPSCLTPRDFDCKTRSSAWSQGMLISRRVSFPLTSSPVMMLRLLTSAMMRNTLRMSASLKSREILWPTYFRWAPEPRTANPHWGVVSATAASFPMPEACGGAGTVPPPASASFATTRGCGSPPAFFGKETTTASPRFSTV